MKDKSTMEMHGAYLTRSAVS